jgi:predicted DNA-binding protein
MSDDMMIRVPRELKKRFNDLERKGSWKGFAAFVREAIRIHLDRHEEIERVNG